MVGSNKGGIGVLGSPSQGSGLIGDQPREDMIDRFSKVVQKESEIWRELRPVWESWMDSCKYLICPIICSDGRLRSSSFGFPIGAIRPIRIAGTLLDPNAFRMEVTRKVVEANRRGKVPLIVEVFHSGCFVMGEDENYRLSVIIEHENIIKKEFSQVKYLAIHEDIFDGRLTVYGSDVSINSFEVFTTEMATKAFPPHCWGNKPMMAGYIHHKMDEGLFSEGLASVAAHVMADSLLVRALRKTRPQTHEEQLIIVGRGLCWLFDSSAFVVTADNRSLPLMEEAWRSITVGLGLVGQNISEDSPINVVTSYTYSDGNRASLEEAKYQAKSIKQFIAGRIKGHGYKNRINIIPVIVNKANCQLTWLNAN